MNNLKIKLLHRFWLIITAACIANSLNISDATASDEMDKILAMPIEDLLNVKVTSVSKKEESAFDATAAIYVITQEDIRRSGATSIPELLRGVPGLHVARIDAHRWAISSRGFNRQFSNKLLVLMDGRSVYTHLFSGVFWELQDTVLEDIDRIEVIRGPGAVMWGANAVNGVINIITKKANATTGNYVSFTAGTEPNSIVEARHGGKIDDKGFYRFYVKDSRYPNNKTTSLTDIDNEWYRQQGGFRIDYDTSEHDSIAIHGDLMKAKADSYFSIFPGNPSNILSRDDKESLNGNIVVRWDRNISENQNFVLQTYFDYDSIDLEDSGGRDNYTFDIDFQHIFNLNEKNEISWGLGYRLNIDDINNGDYLSYTPTDMMFDVYNTSIQDKIELLPAILYLTVGTKLSHNDFTGFEYQPSAKIAYYPSDSQTVWAAISRAVRTPTRAEDGTRIKFAATPADLYQVGSNEYESEELLSYEIGYRQKINSKLNFDVTAFFNDYADLRTFQAFGTNFIATNKANGETYGVEFSSTYQALDNLKLKGSYSFFTADLHLDPSVSGSSITRLFFDQEENSTPKNLFSLSSLLNLPYNLEWDNTVHYADNVTNANAQAYVRLDSRIGWSPKENVEISLVGQNLLDDYHKEFSSALFSPVSVVGRSFYGKVAIEF